MQIHTFIASSAAEAVDQIRHQLGSEAIVLNVRKLPVDGLARLWRKPQIEILAVLPEKPEADKAPEPEATAVEPVPTISALPQADFPLPPPPEAPLAAQLPRYMFEPVARRWHPDNGHKTGDNDSEPRAENYDGWRSGAVLEASGLLPDNVHRVIDVARAKAGDVPPGDWTQELAAVRQALLTLWQRDASHPGAVGSETHIFVGPPGAGKTTALCKWLAQAVLVERRPARVWRLDGHIANTAESLSVFGEILGVPVERCRPEEGSSIGQGLVFVDLPGVNSGCSAEHEQLAAELARYPDARVHLVLNAAYESRLLLRQARAFSSLPIADIVLTHLDEEPGWAKVWNLALGTNFTVGYLSAGQNLPGEFKPADPHKLLGASFPLR